MFKTKKKVSSDAILLESGFFSHLF